MTRMSENAPGSSHLRSAPGEPAAVTTEPSRADLLAKQYAKRGWTLVVVGIIIPALALVGAFIGWRLLSAGRRDRGLPLLVVGLLIGGLRLYLYARTGFRSAW